MSEIKDGVYVLILQQYPSETERRQREMGVEKSEMEGGTSCSPPLSPTSHNPRTYPNVKESWCRMVGGKGRRGISFARRQHRFFFDDFLLLALSYEKLEETGKGKE